MAKAIGIDLGTTNFGRGGDGGRPAHGDHQRRGQPIDALGGGVRQERRTARLDAASLPRLVAVSRLRADLGVNLPGVAVILDLVDRLAAMERELTWLRKRPARLVP
jgi:hypothetical protein